MSETIKRQIHRNWDEAERNRHGQQVRERSAREREERVISAKAVIQEMQDQGVTISQNEVARRTGFSVGFVNKHLRNEIEQAQKQQKESTQKPRTARNIDVLENELEKLKASNKRLQTILDEQRRMNKELLAQAAQVVDLEDEVKRLRTVIKELQGSSLTAQGKVVDLPVQNLPAQGDNVVPISVKTSKNHKDELKPQPFSFLEQVKNELSLLNIPFNKTFQEQIKSKPESVVINAIEALKEAINEGAKINNSSKWLYAAINKESVPNKILKPISNRYTTDNWNYTESTIEEELASLEELKVLSSIFSQPND
ncbi:hypothetical protein VF14_17995 [Nostoc linckia z18]|uniref:Uncharacterized protein n=2 Tax=Nostoc linckia TaxID=92942 RepID=A0A9Q5ZBL4_NOSLI|nr:DUF6262 family protein [Nostoc linckia]PHK41237.1 hypothetical protein VF12_07605 [Nostoc linckia z15]PHK45201.1 hypothetical protein VF13_17555 [Nostoc linckia z16]PHJ62442.1 hypothetical protein VF02_17395 [Nostoc linckia z1]PHJ62516.1 hypothetical protein VF05_26530 [Nostoc linckia z3]PHJ71275.1 hypothetical protein VF03_20590 [Nostoc linckia z2]